MHKEESQTDLGSIKIHHNVIASIAAVAAEEIEGVKRVGGSLKSGILELIGKNPKMAIKVEKDKNNEFRLIIPLVIKYGFNIPEIATQVQENVKNALEKMTDLSVKDISINIQGIEK